MKAVKAAQARAPAFRAHLRDEALTAYAIAMAEINSLFATRIYRSMLQDAEGLNEALRRSCLAIAEEDEAGRAWCRAHGYKGYTSYASLDDLTVRDPAFAALKSQLDPHARAFVRQAHFDLGRRKLRLDSLWINVLEPGGAHSGHIHPGSILSGTYYVAVPTNASALRFEDPRLAQMMAAPPLVENTPQEAARFVDIAPRAGEAILWESFVRHEVPLNAARRPRISVSFNYGW